jgi:hypothetical protein
MHLKYFDKSANNGSRNCDGFNTVDYKTPHLIKMENADSILMAATFLAEDVIMLNDIGLWLLSRN